MTPSPLTLALHGLQLSRCSAIRLIETETGMQWHLCVLGRPPIVLGGLENMELFHVASGHWYPIIYRFRNTITKELANITE